jgi:uncharacterized protein
MDAYPGLTNRVSGHGAGDYGVRHVLEIIEDYTAEPFEAKEPLILISITKSYEDQAKNVYDAVWVPATKANFPWLIDDIPGRFGFEGNPANKPIERLYLRKRVPDEFRAKGAANPVRFIEPRQQT